jgi:hypothetical protein
MLIVDDGLSSIFNPATSFIYEWSTRVAKSGISEEASTLDDSLNDGWAGVAYYLFRLGIRESSAFALRESLRIVDLIVNRTLQASPASEARSIPNVAGSLNFGSLGIWTIAAMIWSKVGETERADFAIRKLLDQRVETSIPLDLTAGQSGKLVALTWLSGLSTFSPSTTKRLNFALRKELSSSLRRLELGSDNRYLGFAHGTTGALFAVAIAHAALNIPLPEVFFHSVALLLMHECAEEGGSWPVTVADRSPSAKLPASWCNGSAGYTLGLGAIFALHRNNDSIRKAALRSAQHTGSTLTDHVSSICCGSTGQAYALLSSTRQLNAYEAGPRSIQLLGIACDWSRDRLQGESIAGAELSLFNGALGSALAILDFAETQPESLPMLVPPFRTQ